MSVGEYCASPCIADGLLNGMASVERSTGNGEDWVKLERAEGMWNAAFAIWPTKGADNPMAFMIVAICCSLSSVVLPNSRSSASLRSMMVAPPLSLVEAVCSYVGCGWYRNDVYLCKDTEALIFVVEGLVRVERSGLW